MKATFCLVFFCLTGATVNAQLIEDNIKVNTTNQPISGYGILTGATKWAQRFTTDDSADLVLRQVEFDLFGTTLPSGVPAELFHLKVGIHADANGFPSGAISFPIGQIGALSAPLIDGNAHYAMFGSVQLQPMTTYWAVFEILQYPYIGDWAVTQISLGDAGTGAGAWLGANDHKSAYFPGFGSPPNLNPKWDPNYHAPLRMIISTVPEPSSLALGCLAAATVFRRFLLASRRV